MVCEGTVVIVFQQLQTVHMMRIVVSTGIGSVSGHRDAPVRGAPRGPAALSGHMPRHVRFRRVWSFSRYFGAIPPQSRFFTYRIKSKGSSKEEEAEDTDFLHSVDSRFESSRLSGLGRLIGNNA